MQRTISVDDDLTAFIDEAGRSGEGSRADLINRDIKREFRRRSAERDAEIYRSIAAPDPDPESDAYASWMDRSARRVLYDPE